MYLSQFHAGLGGITPAQAQALQIQATQIQSQIIQWQGTSCMSTFQQGDQTVTQLDPQCEYNRTVNLQTLQAQLAAVMQQLSQPVDYPAPAPAPRAPAPAPAPTAHAPAPPSAPITPMPGGVQPGGTPIEVEVPSAGPGPGGTITGHIGDAQPEGKGGLWLLLLGGAAILVGGG